MVHGTLRSPEDIKGRTALAQSASIPCGGSYCWFTYSGIVDNKYTNKWTWTLTLLGKSTLYIFIFAKN